MNTKQILAIPMGGNDAGASTIGGYLAELLCDVWRQEEGFSGKRPFGNSGWKSEVLAPLIRAGVIKGNLDEEGSFDEVDEDAADELIDRIVREVLAA